jgi:hypothetical protein
MGLILSATGDGDNMIDRRKKLIECEVTGVGFPIRVEGETALVTSERAT